MKRALTLILILALGLGSGLAIAACGNKQKVVTDTGKNGQTTTKTVADVHFAKTKFLLHAGLAYGAFHRYIQKPLKAGAFKSGAPKQKRTIAKAAVAAAFVYHELKQARRAAESDKTLRTKLLQPFDNVLSQLSAAASSLKSGKLPDLAGLVAGMGGLSSAAGAAGAVIEDKLLPIPGL